MLENVEDGGGKRKDGGAPPDFKCHLSELTTVGVESGGGKLAHDGLGESE